MHVGATHVSANFSRGLVHNFYEGVVVHLMEGLVVPDLNDTKCDLAHRNTTWNKRVAIKNNQQLKKPRPGMQQYTILNDCFDGVKKENYPTTYIQAGASALACQGCSIHTLSSSPDLNKIAVVTLSFYLQKTLSFYPHRWLQIRTYPPPPVKGRRGSVQAVVDSEGGDPLPAAPLSLAERRRGRSSDPFVVACGRIRPPAAHLSTSQRSSGISSFETGLALLPYLTTSLHVHHFLPLSPSRSDGPTSHIFSSIVRGKATSWSRILYLVQTRNKVGVGEFSMYIGLGTNRKERG